MSESRKENARRSRQFSFRFTDDELEADFSPQHTIGVHPFENFTGVLSWIYVVFSLAILVGCLIFDAKGKIVSTPQFAVFALLHFFSVITILVFRLGGEIAAGPIFVFGICTFGIIVAVLSYFIRNYPGHLTEDLEFLLFCAVALHSFSVSSFAAFQCVKLCFRDMETPHELVAIFGYSSFAIMICLPMIVERSNPRGIYLVEAAGYCVTALAVALAWRKRYLIFTSQGSSVSTSGSNPAASSPSDTSSESQQSSSLSDSDSSVSISSQSQPPTYGRTNSKQTIVLRDGKHNRSLRRSGFSSDYEAFEDIKLDID